MFTGKKKSVLIIMIIFIMSFSSFVLFADCDMIAMIAKEGTTISDQLTSIGTFNDPADYFNYICERSNNTTSPIGNEEPYTGRFKINPNGYGIIYYNNNNQLLNIGSSYDDEDNNVYYLTQLTGSQLWYNGTTINWGTNCDQLNYAYYRILNEYTDPFVTYDDDNEDAVIVVAHARKGTGGNGSHPFWMSDINFNNGITYTFMHNGAINGTIKDDIEDYLVAEGWFDGTYNGTVHEQNTTSANWIDSEMLFHYFMKFIMDHDGNVYAGIHDALTQTNIGGTNIQSEFNNPGGYWLYPTNSSPVYTYHEVINFVLSDGQNLYSYRNSPSDDICMNYHTKK